MFKPKASPKLNKMHYVPRPLHQATIQTEIRGLGIWGNASLFGRGRPWWRLY